MMPSRTRPLLCLAAVCAAWLSLPAAAAIPQPFEATYKAKYRGIGVTAVRKLRTLEGGNQYYTFVADSLIAELTETSQFIWSDSVHIVPLRYTYSRSVLGRERKAELNFDWNKGKVVNDVEDKPWTMDVPPQTLDKLSYHLQLRADLLNGKSLRGYEVADGGKLKQYGFEVIGEEMLDTEAGKFEVVKVKRIRDEDEERQTIIWFAKNWDYLVVRLQQEDDGKSYEIDLESATLNGKPVKGE